MSFYSDVYRLKYIIRYSNIPRIKDESVAEHGFFVAAIVMELHDRYEFDLGVALAMAISHDIPEMELNDCPHIIKEKYPKIKMAYDVCEDEVRQNLPPTISHAAWMYDKKSIIEAHVVRLADMMQCIQYAKTEVELGNKGYMQKVLDESFERVKQYKEELKHYERRKETSK